jgi:hypothetical protein
MHALKKGHLHRPMGSREVVNFKNINIYIYIYVYLYIKNPVIDFPFVQWEVVGSREVVQIEHLHKTLKKTVF